MTDMWHRYEQEMDAARLEAEARDAEILANIQRRMRIGQPERSGFPVGALFFALCVCVLVATVMAHYAAAEWTEFNRIQIEGQ